MSLEEEVIVWSVSLVFQHKQLGFLLGHEFRYKDNNNLLHPIGGRTEDYDQDYLATGIREFIEETTIYNSSYFWQIYMDNYLKWFNDNPNIPNNQYPKPSTFIHKEFENLIEKHYYLDHPLYSNKVHRFIIVPIHQIKNNEFKNFITQFPFEYALYDNTIKENNCMWNLHWFRLEQIHYLPYTSKLLQFFEKLFIKNVVQKNKVNEKKEE